MVGDANDEHGGVCTNERKRSSSEVCAMTIVFNSGTIVMKAINDSSQSHRNAAKIPNLVTSQLI
jgi:hypothetical protein